MPLNFRHCATYTIILTVLPLLILLVAGLPDKAEAEALNNAAPALPDLQTEASAQTKAKAPANYKFNDTTGVTDIRLKAEQGSLSRYSGKINIGYLGPVIDNLGNPYQPDPDGSITHNPTVLKGSLSFRIRESAESAINLGTGISRVTPFTEESRTDISQPFISYDHSNRVRAFQLRESVEASLVTNPEMKNAGQYGGLAATFSVIRNIQNSRWEVGADSQVQLALYSRPYDPGPNANPPQAGRVHTRGIASLTNFGDGNASTFSVGLGPSVRYHFADTIGGFAAFHVNYFDPRRSENLAAIQHRALTARLGLDYAITNAVFISPFVMSYPELISLSTTTINISAIFSLF